MANKIGLITKYLPDGIVRTFAAESKTRLLEADPKRIDLNFAGGNTVKILNLDFKGLSDYKRAHNADITAAAGYSEFKAGDATGRGFKASDVGAEWETHNLAYLRAAQLRIDELDDEENAGLLVGNVVGEYLRREIVPEVDAARFSKLAGYTSVLLGNRVVGTIAANTIIAAFNSGFEWMADAEVDKEGQVLFVSPNTMGLVRNTTELQRQLRQDEYKSQVDGITFTITRYEDRLIEEVPSGRFFTDIYLGDGGFYPTASSKVINFLLVNKHAVVPVVKTDKVRVFSPEQVQDFAGYKVNFLIYHDIIVPEKLRVGIYAHISETDATMKVARVNVALAAGASGKTKVTDYATLPIGVKGSLYGRPGDTGFTVGTAIADYSNAVAITLNTDFNAFTGDKGFFCLVENGVVVAVSQKYTSIPKGA